MSSSAIAPAAALLKWYDQHRRRLPWRAEPGERPNAYHVWLSEIMLQQTTVASVIPYYERFVSRFPTVQALADASLPEVLTLWSGLGYYARARNLHACSVTVAANGGFPADIAALRALPGIGLYTADAIAAIAFGIPAVPVDGNIERIAARIFKIEEPLPAARPALRDAAKRMGKDRAARERPSDFAQALFDLGATLCRPVRPSCPSCPWVTSCSGHAAGVAADLPSRLPKPARPMRFGAHFILIDRNKRVLLRHRPARGLLGGMAEFPGTAWRTEPWPDEEALSQAPQSADWHPAGDVRHGFTHFELTITLFVAQIDEIDADGTVVEINALRRQALSSLMRKCAKRAIGPEFPSAL